MNFISPSNNITPNPTIFPTTTITQVPSQPVNTTPKTNQTVTKNLFSSPTSSSTASDEELGGGGGGKRKRKWEAFFAKLTKDMIRKQEELQAKFLETLEKHERERTAREESWRVQEMARIDREHEVLLQERSASTTKDNAFIAFLQEVSVQGHHNYQPPPMLSQPQHPPPPQQQHLPPRQQPIQPTPPPQPPPPPVISTATSLTNMDIVQRSENNNNGGRFTTVVELTSSNRWPKAEVQALISMRTSLDLKYQENGVKGTLWEEVSIGMQRLGYNRNAKKCKEKWENINKYFKKVKDSNKKRSEDSKTCPYFHQLDALYKEKNKNEATYNSHISHIGSNMEPLMVRPEQQWPPPQQDNTVNQSIDGEEEEEEEEEEEGEEIDDEDENGETEEGGGDGGFEVVENKRS